MTVEHPLQTYSFHGDQVHLVSHQGKPYVPLRPIAENIGLWWNTQHKKITDNADRFCVVMMTTQLPGDTQTRLVACIPLRKLPAWLYSIDSRKVKPSLKSRIELYQDECDEALWNYWNSGMAVNRRAAVALGDISRAFTAARRMAKEMGFAGISQNAVANRIVRERLGVDCLALAGLESPPDPGPAPRLPELEIEKFLEDCCVFNKNYQVGKGELKDAYLTWCVETGRPVANKLLLKAVLAGPGVTEFRRRLKNYTNGAGSRKACFKGIGLRTE